MRRLTILTFVAVAAMALIGCPAATNTTTNTNVRTNSMNANSNVAVVVNDNSAVVMNSNMRMSNSNRYTANITREEYDKNRTEYDRDFTGSTIGQGANDKWLWVKTRSALATTNELRDSTINVDVVNDVITLKGSVASKAESDKALAVARAIDGQKGVKNELKVQAGDTLGNQMTGSNTNTKMMNSNR